MELKSTTGCWCCDSLYLSLSLWGDQECPLQQWLPSFPPFLCLLSLDNALLRRQVTGGQHFTMFWAQCPRPQWREAKIEFLELHLLMISIGKSDLQLPQDT